jgi:hypothetical protein
VTVDGRDCRTIACTGAAIEIMVAIFAIYYLARSARLKVRSAGIPGLCGSRFDSYPTSF